MSHSLARSVSAGETRVPPHAGGGAAAGLLLAYEANRATPAVARVVQLSEWGMTISHALRQFQVFDTTKVRASNLDRELPDHNVDFLALHDGPCWPERLARFGPYRSYYGSASNGQTVFPLLVSAATIYLASSTSPSPPTSGFETGLPAQTLNFPLRPARRRAGSMRRSPDARGMTSGNWHPRAALKEGEERE